MIIPPELSANCEKTPERRAWLENLAALVQELRERWSLQMGSPFENATCSWVAPVFRPDGTPAVLKVGMPHMEGRDEIEGLRFWNGSVAVKLYEADDRRWAMLLERCLPGQVLRFEPEPAQDVIVAGLLRKLWDAQPPNCELEHFRHLSTLIGHWSLETRRQRRSWPDVALVEEGMRVMNHLALPAPTDILLVTDLHAGNVLKSEGEPWLVVDPKPFVGDRSYDPVQHLINCETRLHSDPNGLILRVADLAEVDADRVRLWTFARAAADPRDDWKNTRWLDLARRLAP